MLLVAKRTFPDPSTLVEVSDQVRALLASGEGDAGVMDGDLLACTARDAMGRPHLLASFHGDTNGLQSIPVRTRHPLPDHLTR